MTKPIFCATHPRACSTAFERVFMTRTHDIKCIHEPFGDAFYFGPERLSTRYENAPEDRIASGFVDSTYSTVFDRIDSESREGKRLFIKDITHYLVPPDGQPSSIAPSLARKGVGTDVDTVEASEHTNVPTQKAPFPFSTLAEPGNPTVIPLARMKDWHWTFLIRHPRYSIPSYWRCTVPPLDNVTGFNSFMPSEAGYDELRRVFDYLLSQNLIGNAKSQKNGSSEKEEVNITVIDADDLLDDPETIVSRYCHDVGIEYDAAMLNWDGKVDHERAKDAFEKWRGFHEDAIKSTSLKPRSAEHKKQEKSVETENLEWAEKYGEEAAKVIRDCVDANIPDYEYLKSFT